MAIKGYVFDWSGTLSDDRPIIYAVVRDTQVRCGREPYTMPQWLRTSALSYRSFCEQERLHVPPEELDSYFHDRLSHHKSAGLSPTMYADVPVVLGQLHARRVPLGVLSSHPTEHVLGEGASYGIDGLFSLVRGGAADKASALLEFADSFGCDISEILYTGDTVFDIRAAKDAGAVAAGIAGSPQRGYHSASVLRKEKPRFLFGSLADVLRVR
jgi:phosphoglycolate phosphatase-like HAD superfamily hydrolase